MSVYRTIGPTLVILSAAILSFIEIGQEIHSMAIFSFLLISVWQLSGTGERMYAEYLLTI